MDSRITRLICENPHLTTASIARLTGISADRIDRVRLNKSWVYRGYGVPFMGFINCKQDAYYNVSFKGVRVFSGTFKKAIDSVDQLIYCLENNNGQLPPTRKESYFLGLGFGERL
ncbi:hypothetical protein NVP1186O_19 [Vibrio phage 1.186.O._10N.286.49.E3]|nr:hypothetical protein NVP1186O_19 [Vibrio phage 1.186.O._10N.286.49.E3]